MASPTRGGRCRVAKVGRRETRVLVLRLDLGDVEGVARRAREFLRFNRARAAQKELSCAAPRCAASSGALVFCTSAPSLHTLSHTAAEVLESPRSGSSEGAAFWVSFQLLFGLFVY